MGKIRKFSDGDLVRVLSSYYEVHDKYIGSIHSIRLYKPDHWGGPVYALEVDNGPYFREDNLELMFTI